MGCCSPLGRKLRIDLLRREKEGDEQGDGESPKIIQMVTRPGKHTKNYGKSPFLMGKSTISMAIFNSKPLNYQRVPWKRFDLAIYDSYMIIYAYPPFWGQTHSGHTKKNNSWLAVILWMWLTIWIPDTVFFSAWWIEKNEDGYLKNSSSSTVPTHKTCPERNVVSCSHVFFSTTRLPWPSFNWCGQLSG